MNPAMKRYYSCRCLKKFAEQIAVTGGPEVQLFHEISYKWGPVDTFSRQSSVFNLTLFPLSRSTSGPSACACGSC